MSGLREELEKVAAKHGRLTPALVLKEAKRETHPLHSQFTWDDDEAAAKYRLLQARDLISKVRVHWKNADDEPRSIRRYHALRASDEAQYDYLDVEDIIHDPIKRKLLMQSMEREWRQMVARFETFNEFWELVRASARGRKKAS